MKQLLRALTTTTTAETVSLSGGDEGVRKSCYDNAVVVGLGSHAFLILSNQHKHVERQKQPQNQVQVIALTPPPPPPPLKPSEETVECKDDPLQEVLAVGIFSVPTSSSSSSQNGIWCAVARGNKSLALYLIDPSEKSVDASKATSTSEIGPVNVYHTSKRVGCLTFCQVPESKEDTPNVASNQPLFVILAGDLVGDVTAYKVEESEIPVSASNETATSSLDEVTAKVDEKDGQQTEGDGASGEKKDEDEDGDDDEDESGPRQKRLLLGHTASMLTGLCLLDQHGLMLTADRDEKIRVTAFPNTYLIHGFLLGHTAFVSSMAIVTLKEEPNEPLCVSVGGDGVLRLWNVTTTCQELSNIAAPFMRPDEDDEDDDTGRLVPSQMAVHNTTIAVLYDQSTRVDIYEITSSAESANGNEKYALQCMQTLQCPASPLSVEAARGVASDESPGACFWLVCREPRYLIRLDINRNSNGTPAFQWNQVDTVTTALQQAINNTGKSTTADADKGEGDVNVDTATAPIVMPMSIWERDANGLLKVAKVHDKRYGGSTETQLPTPWNRADRIEIARQRNLRHKKRRQEKSEIRYKQRKEEKKRQEEQQQPQNNTTSTTEKVK